MYFGTRPEIVDNFIDNIRKITINNEISQSRRLITPSERLILSNICPTIPHSILEQTLQQTGIKLLSSTTFLKVNTTDPEYAHVLSFQRQVCIAPPENLTIPESLLINQCNTVCRILISQDTTCFRYKQPAHFAYQSPNQIPEHTPVPEIIHYQEPPPMGTDPLKEAELNPDGTEQENVRIS
ncbi:hypothetical protein HHI36_001740 [Cryptolaemus montrouzieri]|uniref:Envelope protein n=1 Tax=Cryptolaemus montrouzieri TaxID=559131 RepID=A0ABD2P8I6_9CUCU